MVQGCLPVLQLSIAQVIDALAERYGEERRALISFAADAGLEALFGKMPALKTPHARAAGFQHDRNAAALADGGLSRVLAVFPGGAVHRGDAVHPAGVADPAARQGGCADCVILGGALRPIRGTRPLPQGTAVYADPVGAALCRE